MQTDTIMNTEPSVFTINKNDIGFLLHRLQLQAIAESPLHAFADGNATATGTSAEELLQNNLFVAAMQVLATPQCLIRVYAGGGTQPHGDLFICIQTDNKTVSATAVTPTQDNNWAVIPFSETKQCINWLLDFVAVENETAAPAVLPETFTPEFLLYVLGAIDQYKRCGYEALLQYRQEESPVFSLNAFADNMQKAMKSADLRWLLPSFVVLTPGFSELNLTANSTVYEQLIDADIMLPVESTAAEPLFTFGETGKELGEEFSKNWMQSAGIEVNNFSGAGVAVQHRAFLAATLLTNHLFEIENTETGSSIKYASMSPLSLTALLEEWITKTVAEPATVKAEETTTQQAAASVKKFCPQCGEPVRESTKFCAKCGKPLIA